MAGRIRTIKPELLEDDKTASLGHVEFRLFVALLLLADDHGGFRAQPNQLTGAVFWGCVEQVDTSSALETLARVGLISLFTSGGQPYGHITNWNRHQRVDHPSKPRVPSPRDEGSSSFSRFADIFADSLANVSRGSRDSLAPDLRPPTSDLRPTTNAADAAPQFDLKIQEPVVNQRKSRMAKETTTETDLQAGWRIWRDEYEWVEGHAYIAGGACGRAMKGIVMLAHRSAKERGGSPEKQRASLELCLRHWFRCYLQDRDKWLEAAGHVLRHLDARIPRYCVPWAKNAPATPQRPGKRHSESTPRSADQPSPDGEPASARYFDPVAHGLPSIAEVVSGIGRDP
jgi:hypothetical protein